MRAFILLFIVIFTSAILYGCSGGGTVTSPGDENPAPGNNSPPDGNPPNNDEPEEPVYTHFLFGAAQFEFNGSEITRVTQNSAQTHYNLTDPLSPPLCPDCITIEQLWHNEVAQSIGLSISLRNPSEFTFYDVRGIIRGGEGLRLVDSDGFTDLFSPEPVGHNPYLMYCLEKPDIDFTPDYTDTRAYSLTYEELTDLNFKLIVEGSYPGHCEEPAILRVVSVDDENLNVWGGAASITVKAIDRQDDILGLIAAAPDLWDDVKDLQHISGNEYKVDFTNEKFAPAGSYRVIFSAWSHDPDELLITQVAFVEINNPSPASIEDFLGEGHPIEGVNYHRNNRSPYLLPAVLAGDDSIAPFTHGQHSLHTVDKKFSTMVVDSDERLYIGRSLYDYDGYEDANGEGNETTTCDLWSFYFDGDWGGSQSGGKEIINTTVGVFSLETTYYRSWSYATMGPSKGFSGEATNSSSVCKYFPWYELIVKVQGSYSRHWIWGGDTPLEFGDPEFRWFTRMLPIPEGRLLVSFSRGANGPKSLVQLLDETFEVIKEYELTEPVSGFALNTINADTYIAAGAGLYCYDSSFEEKWDTTSTVPVFTDDIPVITDDSGILGCLGGTLRRIEQDGTPGPEKSCGARLRPAILNDGTIAVITDLNIKFFDGDLNQTGELPLPSGPGTGSGYSRPPLVDAGDNMALFAGVELYIIDIDGNILAQRTFESEVREIRLGPEHLFVALDYEIYRFPS